MLPTAAQVRQADEYMATASKKQNVEGQFVVYSRAWKLLKHLDDPAYYARQRDCLAKLIAVCRKMTDWTDAERDAAIAKYQAALGKLSSLLSPEEKALLARVHCLLEKGLTIDNVDSQFVAYQQAWKQLKKQKAPALIPTMRDCLEKLIAVCHQMTDWEEEGRSVAIQKYQTILVGLTETASAPLANTDVNETSSVAAPANSLSSTAALSQLIVASPASSSAMPRLAPKVTELFSVVPFASTEKLVLAYQLQKKRCLQHPEDESSKQRLHDIEDIIQNNIIVHEMTLSESSLKQSVVLLGAGLSDRIVQLLTNRLFKLIADNPLDFLDEFAAAELGLMKTGDKLTEAQLTQVTSSLVQKMQGLYAPDIAMTCLVLNTLYQTLAEMMSKQVSHVSQVLYLASIKAALYNLRHRLQAMDTQTEDKVVQCQWIDIRATIEYALDSLTHFTTEEMPWQQCAHYARVTGTLLLQAAGIDAAVTGSAMNAAVLLLQRLWRRGRTIYRYCHCHQPYFATLKKWQVHFVDEVLPQYPLWDNALMSLRLPIEDNDKSRLWLKNSNVQVGVMRTLMAVYDMPIQGIEMPATRATLQKKTVQLLINYYQQSVNQLEKSHQLVRLTAAQYLLSLQPQLTALQTESINTLITSADRELLKGLQIERTTADEARVITIDSPTNIALQGWRQRYPDDEALYRLLRSYPTLPAEEKGGFLQCMQEFIKDGSTKQLSYWGREVIAALDEDFISAIRQLPICSGPAGPVKFTFAGIMAAARGKIIAHKRDIGEAKRVKMTMLREHLGLLSDMATKHGLFERWESQMDKWRIGELIAAGVIEASVAPIISPHEIDVEILPGQAAVPADRTRKIQPLVMHRRDAVSWDTDAAAAVTADAVPNPLATYSQIDNSTIFIFGQLSIDPQFPIDTLLDKLATLLRSGHEALPLELMRLAERFNASGTSERALYCYAAAYCAHLQCQSLCPPTLVPCIERLLNTLTDTGFSPDARLRCMQKPNSAEGETWLHYFIATYPAPHLIDYLLDQEQHQWQLQARYRDKTPLMLAIQSGDDALCRQLLTHDATTAGCDGAGNTCLHLACQQGSSKVIPDLLAVAKPASMEVVGPLNAARDTVLHALCVSGCDEWGCYEDILRCFPSAVNQCNLAGYFPLQLAACYASPSIFTALQAKTTAVISPGKDGKTCLHLAAEFGNAAIVQFLAPQGEVNVLDGMQCTPLQLAARGEQLGQGRSADDYRQVFIALLQHGADETVRNCQGQTVRDTVSHCQAIQEVFEQAWAQLAPKRLLQRWQMQCATYYTQPSFVNKRLFDKDYFSLADYFVNLQLVKEVKLSANGPTTNQDELLIRPLRERDRKLKGRKTAIALSDVFQPAQYQDMQDTLLGVMNTVVVSGAAGVGKTTLSDYIAYQWALAQQEQGKSGLWSDFDMVLIIRCRGLRSEIMGPNVSEWNIAKLLCLTCWNGLGILVVEVTELLSQWQEHPDKCLLLLDGLDELPMFERDSVWHGLLKQLFGLPFKKLVTTRPYAVTSLGDLINYDRLIEISGFTDNNVSVYFDKILKQPDKTNVLIRELKKNRNLWEIAHIPINAYLLKRWWIKVGRRLNEQKLAQLSQIHLYESLVVDLCRRLIYKTRHLEKSEVKFSRFVVENERLKLMLTVLGQWAFEGLVQDTTELCDNWLDGVAPRQGQLTLLAENALGKLNITLEQLESSGLIQHMGKIDSGEEFYSFFHLTFQEFLAAWVIKDYLSCGTEIQKLLIYEVIKTYKYHPNFTLVWPFVAGLLKPYSDAQEDFFQLLLQAPRDWVGLVDEDLFMRCLEASLSPDDSMELLEGKQQSLMRSVDQKLKKLHAMPEKLQERFQVILKPCYQIQRCLFNSIVTLLVDSKVDENTRTNFARCLATHISQDSKKMNTMLALIRNEEVNRKVRYALLRDFLKHISLDYCKLDAVLALLKNERVNGMASIICAHSLTERISKDPDKVSAVLTLLRDNEVNGAVRIALASGLVKLILQSSDEKNMLFSSLKKEKVDGKSRVALAWDLIMHISEDAKKIDAVFFSLKKSELEKDDRIALARNLVSYLSQGSNKVDTILMLLENEQEDEEVRLILAYGWAKYTSQASGKMDIDAVFSFLKKEAVNEEVRLVLACGLALHVSQAFEMDTVLGFLKKKAVNEKIHTTFIYSLVLYKFQKFQASDKIDVVLAFLENEAVNDGVRTELNKVLVKYLYQGSEKQDAVWVLLKDEELNENVRAALACDFINCISKDFGKVDAVCNLLKSNEVNGKVRIELALGLFHFVSLVRHISRDYGKADAMWALLIDKRTDKYVSSRILLARQLIEYMPMDSDKVDVVLRFLTDRKIGKYIHANSFFRIRQLMFRQDDILDVFRLLDVAHDLVVYITADCEKKVDTILALLENEQVNEDVRVAFAYGLLGHRPGVYGKMDVLRKPLKRQANKKIRAMHTNKIDALWALLKNRKVSEKIRDVFAEYLVAHISQGSNRMDVALALFENKEENKKIRITLALGLVKHIIKDFDKMDVLLTLLMDENVDGYDRRELAHCLVPHLPKWPDKIKLFLKGVLLKSRHSSVDMFSDIDIPAYLIVPIYEQTDARGRRYIIKQLIKNNVVLVEQEDKVMIIEAGQINSLSLASSTIKQIKQDLSRYYHVDINHSASLLSEYSLVSNSQTANPSSSQDRDAMKESCSEISTSGVEFHNADYSKQTH